MPFPFCQPALISFSLSFPPFVKHLWDPQHDRCYRDISPRSQRSCDVIGMSAPPPRLIPSSWLQALDVTKRCNTSCSSHSISQHQCAGIFSESLPLPFVLFGSLWWTFQASPSSSPRPLPNIPGRAQAPVAVVTSSHPQGLSYQRHNSPHITQLTRQQPEPGSLQRSGRPWAKPPATQWMDHLPVVSRKPQRHHFSVPKWQCILKWFPQSM